MIAPDLAGRRFGSWTILAVDPTGKRVACRCVCGRVQQVAVAALQSGERRSCGCSRGRPEQRSKPDFAADLVAAELFGARHRHRGGSAP